MAKQTSGPSVEVKDLSFSYPGQAPFISGFSFQLQPGSRCLLVGANGSGKTTLLRILAGKHMVGGKDVVRILGRSAFHDTSLVCKGDLVYLGESWNRNIGSAGEIPLQGDFSAGHMIFGVEGADPLRRQRLIDLLDINLHWRMHKVSDGQRRRVQICMGLLQPFKVLLLDEITVDLDVVARMDLLYFFEQECIQRAATIIYATHIFDGLETWVTHMAYVKEGRLQHLTDMKSLLNSHPLVDNLLEIIEPWLRKEKQERKEKALTRSTAVKITTSPWASSRHMAYYK